MSGNFAKNIPSIFDCIMKSEQFQVKPFADVIVNFSGVITTTIIP